MEAKLKFNCQDHRNLILMNYEEEIEDVLKMPLKNVADSWRPTKPHSRQSNDAIINIGMERDVQHW